MRIPASVAPDGLSIVPWNSMRPVTRGPGTSGTTRLSIARSPTWSDITAHNVASDGIGAGPGGSDVVDTLPEIIAVPEPGGAVTRVPGSDGASCCGRRTTL